MNIFKGAADKNGEGSPGGHGIHTRIFINGFG
jgi:hypothetical protein